MTGKEPQKRTRPWERDEYIHVDGKKLGYSATDDLGIINVFFGGCKKASIDELMTMGCSIVYPKSIRTNDFHEWEE